MTTATKTKVDLTWEALHGRTVIYLRNADTGRTEYRTPECNGWKVAKEYATRAARRLNLEIA